jgi:signal transduction histidine kinase
MLRQHDLRRSLAPVTSPAAAEDVRHVVENLVANAVKYGPGATPIEVVLEGRGSDAVLGVHDAGRVLQDDDVDRLFERGFRTTEAQRTATGEGLGLSLVAKLVAGWGGQVGCDVDTDGTTFWCTLPLGARSGGPDDHAATLHEAH